jgi:UDPglucose 6-dehydrogenase
MGFVGLTTALGFAEKGMRVCGFEHHPERLATLQAGRIPFHEPHLEEALARHLGKGFRLDVPLREALEEARAVFFCVGTPAGPGGEADLTDLTRAVEGVLPCRAVLTIKSTVPPSTARERILPLLGGHGLLASNPEFLREGMAWDDFLNPDRIVVGELNPESGAILEELYRPFGAPVHRVSLTTAEFVKYLSNTMLATMISFANEQSVIAHAVGDVEVARAFRILHEDRRWFGRPARMKDYVYPGCGFGGYCLPKDMAALIARAESAGVEPRVLRSALAVNGEIRGYHLERLAARIVPGARVGILGLAFKPGSDDVRDTPAREIVEGLLQRGYRLTAYDPVAGEAFLRLYGLDIQLADDLDSLVASSDHLVLLTAWPEFREKQALLRTLPLDDLRYAIDP